MTHAYSQLYLAKVSRAVGNMLHNAVYEFKIDGTDFLNKLIQSDVAEQIENGNPKYIAGKSGFELLIEVIEKTSGEKVSVEPVENYDRSDVYWVGWMLTHYQWYSGRTFRSILDTISFDELLGLYGMLHEADINKSYEVIDEHFDRSESKLKKIRKQCGMTQDELAVQSGVSVNTIKAYERKSKDLNKAQFDIILKLTKALKCKVSDLIE